MRFLPAWSKISLLTLQNAFILFFFQFLQLFVFLKLLYPFFHLGLQQSLVGQIELISRSIDVCVLRQSEFHQGIVLLLAEQDTNGWLLEVLLYVTVEIVDIHLHLSKVLMGELVNLQVDEDITLQQAVVEHQIK